MTISELPVLTPKEAAKIMRIGTNTIYSLLRSGKLYSVRIGRKILIPTNSIELYFEPCYNNNCVSSSLSPSSELKGDN